MKKSYLVVTIALASFLILGISGISFGQEFFVKDGVEAVEGPKWIPGEIIVKFKPGVSDEVIDNINLRHGTSVISTSRFADFKRLRIPVRKTVAEMVEIYKRNPNVEYAEPNFIAHAFMIPNDPYYGYQWHMRQINMEAAWEITTGYPNVIVAVIDTGIAYENYEEFVDNPGPFFDYWITYQQAPDLALTNFVTGYDFVNNDAHPNDDEGHGTHVAGTIAQSTNNLMGVAGVAFHTSIMPIKVLNSGGSGTHADIADGIYFAADNSANIINMSLGGSSGSITLENALAHAYGKGVTIVCASGNDGSATTVSYPAAYDAYCIAVGATRYDEAVAYYSNCGSSLDLTAPGGDVYVDQNGDGYADGVLQQTFDTGPTDFGYWFYQGTSMAAPHVSGVAALLIANGVASTPAEVREALQSTAMDRGAEGWDPEYGWGIVDAYAALNYSSVPNSPPIADPGGPYTGTEDQTITFDGLGSSDPDGDTLTYLWDFGDGSPGAGGVNPDHTYTAGGEYTVTLIVNDGKVDSVSATTTADIAEVNDPPVADAGPDQTSMVGQVVTFDGSGSYDIDDGIVGYVWDFGDGETGSGETFDHAYSDAGIYSVTLTVTDNSGATDTDEAIVTVTEQPSNTDIFVSNLDGSSTSQRNKWTATVTITVSEAVSGALVTGTWSDGVNGPGACTTVDGTCSVSYSRIRKNISSVTFTINGIELEPYTYDPALNAVDYIIVTKP